jgi:hypothetical protein
MQLPEHRNRLPALRARISHAAEKRNHINELPMSTHARNTSSDLVQRIYGEFLEMPGLRLTRQQAQRLWGLDAPTCLELLELLVDAKFLCRADNGMYARLTDGHAEYPRPRTARASIEVTADRLKRVV